MCRQNYKTDELKEEIEICNDLNEFRQQILESIPKQMELWKQKMKDIIEKNGYTKTEMAELCDVSRVTIDKWCKGALPKNRETFIRIGFAAHYTIEEMNRLLTRYGRYPGLYAKSLEDLVCIFVLSSDEIPHTYEKYSYLLKVLKEELCLVDRKNDGHYDTSALLIEILNLSTEKELIEYVNANSNIFLTQYHRLYAYIEAFISLNCYDEVEDSVRSTYFLANGQQWSSSLRQCVSAIRQKKWYPVRNKIISLGLHLNMDVAQIDEMLELAHMEPLYARNPFEAAIMYALENAKLEGMIFSDGTDTLCVYVKKVLKDLSIREIDFFLNELPEEY